MNIVHDVRVEPDRIGSGGVLTAHVDFESEPGSALLVGWSPGFHITAPSARPVTSQALQVPPDGIVDLTIRHQGAPGPCRITFTLRGSDGRTDGPPRSVRVEVT